MIRRWAMGGVMWCFVVASAVAADEAAGSRPALEDLPEWQGTVVRPKTDWLLDNTSFKAGVFRGAGPNELVLANGLIARTFRLAPNAATVALDNLVTGEAILRGVKPEAIVAIDGQRYEVGGLTGQPNYAFLRPEWLENLRANPGAFQFVGFEVGRPAERLAWKRVRHHAPGVKWPPDGSYPGDVCQGEQHPGHRGLADSRWTQWRTISDFYKWCRGEGIFLNVPDHYFLAGSNKTGMGYREVNWSLPREQQVIHTRQNIFDGTWEKTPSMGWMFVPLTEYQGGGSAATIEPLDEHLDHYERMLTANLALGVQACYRGPRLYDSDRTKAMVKRWVDWFKTHREILESDLIHGRRADARDLDWMLHVNPQATEKGLLVVFNPLGHTVERTLRVNVYYTGLSDIVQVSEEGGPATTVPVQRDYTMDLRVQVPPQAMKWFVLK